jgi:predicted transcriptional regulator
VADPDKPAKLRRALELAEQGYSLRYIAKEIGKSHTCVRDWIEEYREAEGWVGLYELAEERVRRLMRLEVLAEWLMDEYKLGAEKGIKKGPAATYVPLLLQVEDRRARLTGSDSNTKVDVNGTGLVDARAVWEAVQEARARLGESEG